MFDNKIMQAIDKLADEELLYSKVQHKERFASLHEAESIIREELEEMEEEAPPAVTLLMSCTRQ